MEPLGAVLHRELHHEEPVDASGRARPDDYFNWKLLAVAADPEGDPLGLLQAEVATMGELLDRFGLGSAREDRRPAVDLEDGIPRP
jgi:hypothetical protein